VFGVILNGEKMNEQKNMEDVKAMADPKCSRCFGRGRVGVNLDNHVIQLCRCVKKKIKIEEDEARRLQAEKEKQPTETKPILEETL
jgi:hypothetical protein